MGRDQPREGAAMSDDKPKPDPSTWVDEHGDVLYRFALLRVKDPHVAEDLVQETLIAALQGLKNYRGGSSVRTWLVGILKHKIFDYFRKSAKEIATTDLTLLADETGEDTIDRVARRPHPSLWQDDPHNLLENKDFWKAFLACLDGLSPTFRTAFSMREMDGLGTAEICKILDITSTNLWVILHRARAKLRRCLDINWFQGSR
jgi:RNA polymerase sigma-70 factor (ECF subfamily)